MGRVHQRGGFGKLKMGAAAAAVAMLASACGATGAQGNASSGNSGGGGGGSTATGSGGQTIKLITWVNPPAVDAFKKIDAEFHKAYPKLNVDLQTAASITGPYATLLQTSVDSGSADIVTDYPPLNPLPLKPTKSNESTWQYWSTHNVFAPLDGQSFLSRYTSSALKAETYNGKVYGLVSGSYQEGVFYNKATFAKYNLTPPTTYSQFLSELKTLKAHGVTPLFDALGNVGPVYLQFLYYDLIADDWYPSAPGGNLATDLENGTVKWTAPQFTKVMQQEKTIAKYLEPNYTGVPWEAMPGDFAKGDAAMLLDGSWDMAAVHSANPSAKVGFFPLPGSNTAANNQPYVADNLTFSVLKSSKHKAAAMKWLQFFSKPSIYAQYVAMTGISPSQSAGHYAGFTASTMGSWFGKGINDGKLYPVLSPTDAYWDQPTNWPKLQQDVINGSKTPKQVQQLYQQDWKSS